MCRILFPIVLFFYGNSVKAQPFDADSLLQKLSTDPKNRTKYLDQLQDVYKMLNEGDFSNHVKKAVKIIEQDFDEKDKVAGYRFLGEAYWSKNRYEESLVYYNKSIATALRTENISEA